METPERRETEPTSLVPAQIPAQIPAPMPVQMPAQPSAVTTQPLIAQAAEAVGGISKQRKLAALLIAAVADAISLFAELIPPLEWALDIVTAIALFAVLGWRWQLLPVLVVEAVPGLAAFPTWVLVVGVIAGTTPTK